ncbi:MAG TPA: transposase [Terriglobales bacterium]|nr:transposase [Terriglobales bacterium]
MLCDDLYLTAEAAALAVRKGVLNLWALAGVEARGFSPGGADRVFFVTSVTWGRRALFLSDRFARLFLEILVHYRGQGCYQLHDFVLMPEHFHLLLTPAKTLSLEQAVQRIKGGFSYRTKKDLGFSGEIWERSFTNHRIHDLDDYAVHRQYIEVNPVRKRLCSQAAEYAYSSANPAFVLDPLPRGLKPRLEATPVSQG